MVSKKRVRAVKGGVWGRRDLYILAKLFRRITPDLLKQVKATNAWSLNTMEEEVKVLKKFTASLYTLQTKVTDK